MYSLIFTMILDAAIHNRKDVETFEIDRPRKLLSSNGGLILMIGGDGPNGNDVEVITGKGKEVVVRVKLRYLASCEKPKL